MDYKKEYENLQRRFRHLLESEFIRGFDAYDPYKEDYVRDIKRADEMGFRNKNDIVIGITADGLDEILEKTREIASNMERTEKRFKHISSGYIEAESADDSIHKSIISAYLDSCINNWEKKKHDAMTARENFIAKIYIDAYQCTRAVLLGEEVKIG